MNPIKPGRNSLARREFLLTVGAGAAVLANPFTSHQLLASGPGGVPQPPPKSDRPSVAVIGLGGRGRGMALWQFPTYADVLAVCDVDRRRSGSVAEEFRNNIGRKLDVYNDYRKLLERRDIQVIVNATPEHWHSKINIDACLAGKDVYTEKPLTFTIDEMKILRRVLQETGRIVQVGTQQRSGPQFQIVCSLVQRGRIGRLKQVALYLPAGDIEPLPACQEVPAPKELNWGFWTGQAPLHPYCDARFNRASNWSDYGGGLVTGWGTHHMDIAHWGMGDGEFGPLSVEAEGFIPNGGRPGYPDQYRPFAARLEYPGDVELWFLSAPPDPSTNSEYRDVIERVYGKVPAHIRNYDLTDPDGGILFIGDKGSIFVGRAGVSGEGIAELERMPLPETGHLRWRSCLYEHTNNFLNCIRTRQQPASHAAGQIWSQLPCHLVNIALRLGRKLNWDAEREEFIGDSEANGQLKRPQRAPYQIRV